VLLRGSGAFLPGRSPPPRRIYVRLIWGEASGQGRGRVCGDEDVSHEIFLREIIGWKLRRV